MHKNRMKNSNNTLSKSQTDLFDPPVKKCPLCSSFDIQPGSMIERYQVPFKVDRCMECGFQFMNPRFSTETVSQMYNKDYYSGRGDYSYYDERRALRYSRYVWEKRVRAIRRYIRSGNFLDIGCAFGGLLDTAKKYYTPFGIEMSLYSGEYALKSNPGRIHIGTLKDHPFQKNFFSVITMIELIEHLSDPRRAIEECYSLLSKGGLLLIQTANMDGVQAKVEKDQYAYYMPGHLSYFTKKNLLSLLQESGFKQTRVFYPVEFGLMPKLLKSRYSFHSLLDYRSWLRISLYHLISKIHCRNFAATSSMVIYAFK